MSVYLELAWGTHLLVVSLVNKEEIQGIGHMVGQQFPTPNEK